MNEAIEPLIRNHFKTMQGYVSAGMEDGKDEEKIYLNANENPYDLPGLEGLNRYPEPQPPALLEAYAQNYGVQSDQIVMTRGADEALSLITSIFCEPHKDQILINAPTFGMYAVNAHMMPSGVVSLPLVKEGGTFALNHTEIIKCATASDQNIKIVYLCSPNNPTGNSFPHDLIIDICEAVEGHAVVVLDETYAEFSKQGSMSDDLDSTPNLIILRTLSKSFSFAGMRMGSLLCADTDFINLVKTKALDAYPLPRMSIEAAFHVLSPEIKKIALKNIQTLIIDRDKMAAALGKSGKINHVYPSDANFILFEMEDAKKFHTFCAQHNVIIRDFSSKPGTENCLRLSIGTPEENNRVLELLEQFTAL